MNDGNTVEIGGTKNCASRKITKDGSESDWSADRYDSATEGVPFKARERWAMLGVWGQQHPAGYVDGPNTYQFVLSSPTNFIDSSGRQATRPGPVVRPSPPDDTPLPDEPIPDIMIAIRSTDIPVNVGVNKFVELEIRGLAKDPATTGPGMRPRPATLPDREIARLDAKLNFAVRNGNGEVSVAWLPHKNGDTTWLLNSTGRNYQRGAVLVIIGLKYGQAEIAVWQDRNPANGRSFIVNVTADGPGTPVGQQPLRPDPNN